MTSKGKTKRPAHIDKALKELRTYARSEMAKNQIVQFRVDDADFERLVQMATHKECPIGTMVRSWVFERLKLEELDAGSAKHPNQSGKSAATSDPRSKSITYDQIVPTLEEMKKRMSVFEAALDKLETSKPKKQKLK